MGVSKSKGVEDFGLWNLVHDKDEPAAPIPLGPIWGPIVEPLGHEQCVLRSLHDSGPIGPIGEAHDPFHSQKVIAAL